MPMPRVTDQRSAVPVVLEVREIQAALAVPGRTLGKTESIGQLPGFGAGGQ